MDNFIKKLDIENSSEIECMSFKIILYNLVILCQNGIAKIDIREKELKKEKKNEQ